MAKPIRFLHTDDYNETNFNVRYERTDRKYERIKQRLEQITRDSKKYRQENHNWHSTTFVGISIEFY